MKLGIIAAGEGSRLRQDGVTVPKPLLPINGVPMIERILRAAIRNGLHDICCVVNEAIAEQCGYLTNSYNSADVTFSLFVRSTPSSLHSLAVLAPYLRGTAFSLMTTDAVCPEDEFSRYLSRTRRPGNGDGVLAVTRYVDDEKPLYAELDGQMRITRFSDVPDQLEWVTGGLYVFSERVLDMVDPAIRTGTQRLRNFLRLLLENKCQLFGFPFSKIIDVDHASDIAAAEELLSEKQRNSIDS